MTWRRWSTVQGKSTPEKCLVQGTFRQAIQDLLQIMRNLNPHLFCVNWNRCVFDYIRKNSEEGFIVQIFEFAMNFRKIYQDEVQSAYWDGMQTCIHAVINYFKCPNDCSGVVTLVLAQITDDLKHDSFIACAGHNAVIKYLAQDLGLDLDYVLQFCDNCSSQCKSHRPFAEMARSPLKIVHVFFGEKHGKSHCDGFFGRLKAWMTFKIKSCQFIVTNATDFYRCCKEEYETPQPEPGKCQHYRLIFQYLKPADIRRHQDCDLENAIPGTRSLYSVRNTPHPLKLQVRHIPCLCTSCIKEDGQNCVNKNFADEWQEVDLVPVKGQSKKTHQK